jgi:hypothetical protein
MDAPRVPQEVGVIEIAIISPLCTNTLYNFFLQFYLSQLPRGHETTEVGAAGLEPATSCSQSRRDNRTTLRPEYNREAL